MAKRNYYIVLGVESTESAGGIRAAFRDLARRYHPDHAGPEGAPGFREIAEAYGVLRDPQRRRRYDEDLSRAIPSFGRMSEQTRSQPLVRELSLGLDTVEVRPSREALLGRFERNFTRVGVPKSERLEELQVDVAISLDEAHHGTTISLGVPVFVPCPGCRGRGCRGCADRGVVERERAVRVRIPPLAGSGTTLVVPLTGLDIENLYLSVRVRVSPESGPISRGGG